MTQAKDEEIALRPDDSFNGELFWDPESPSIEGGACPAMRATTSAARDTHPDLLLRPSRPSVQRSMPGEVLIYPVAFQPLAHSHPAITLRKMRADTSEG